MSYFDKAIVILSTVIASLIMRENGVPCSDFDFII
jgi:hypothetical protein